MIEKTRPDIVVIPTRTDLHSDLCLRVLEHRVNIDVEKPICVDLVQADAVIAKTHAKAVRVAVHHQSRVDAPMRALALAVEEGRIGQIRYIYASDQGLHGGYGLMYIGTHLINNILKFSGPCRSVVAVGLTGDRPITPADVYSSVDGMGIVAGDRLTATFQFDGGVTATLLQHLFPRTDAAAYGMEIYGTEGRLFWKRSGAWWLGQPHFVPDGEHDRWQALPLVPLDHFDPAKGAERDDYWFVEEYVRALDEGRDHDCSGAAARHCLEIMMGIFEAAVYGTRVELPQQNREHPLLRWQTENGLGLPQERTFASG
jgi:predicted dehydrogenase